jgi:transglutaminase-like putative cysteine protease
MPKFKIRHITKYIYEDTVRDSANQIMLYPIRDQYQEILHHHIEISGNPSIDLHKDYYGNDVGTFTHAQPHKELVIDSHLEVATSPRDMPHDDRPIEEQWNELQRMRYQLAFIDFFKGERIHAVQEIEKIIDSQSNAKATPLQATRFFMEYVFKNFEYRKGITTIETTPDEIWKIRSGVCQDFAHILLVMLRMMNIPARYVSGYICPNKNGMRGEGATHAWVEAYIPFYGWLGFDPTNNCVVNETHVRLAVGKNFADCSPVKGTYRGTSNHTLEVTVSVAYEDGSSTQPDQEIVKPAESSTSVYKNSFRRYQEMQMQQ